VESEAQREVLQRQGYQRMQGYLFGKPVPADEFSSGLAGARIPAAPAAGGA
jgi:EAL domain-containing protein (putative c-di-GMP-specific phosphodiesterase class I)